MKIIAKRDYCISGILSAIIHAAVALVLLVQVFAMLQDDSQTGYDAKEVAVASIMTTKDLEQQIAAYKERKKDEMEKVLANKESVDKGKSNKPTVMELAEVAQVDPEESLQKKMDDEGVKNSQENLSDSSELVKLKKTLADAEAKISQQANRIAALEERSLAKDITHERLIDQQRKSAEQKEQALIAKITALEKSNSQLSKKTAKQNEILNAKLAQMGEDHQREVRDLNAKLAAQEQVRQQQADQAANAHGMAIKGVARFLVFRDLSVFAQLGISQWDMELDFSLPSGGGSFGIDADGSRGRGEISLSKISTFC